MGVTRGNPPKQSKGIFNVNNQQKPQNTQGHIRDQNKGKIVQTFNQLNGKECRPPKKTKTCKGLRPTKKSKGIKPPRVKG